MGQVISGYKIDYQLTGDSAWKVLSVHGETVGRRVVDWGLGRMAGVSALRWTCTQSLDPALPATVSAFGAYLGAPLN